MINSKCIMKTINRVDYLFLKKIKFIKQKLLKALIYNLQVIRLFSFFPSSTNQSFNAQAQY